MDVLELALKHSIDWSIRNRRPQFDEASKSSIADGLELAKRRANEESHVRAFVTQFKIELNNLMGLKWTDERATGARSVSLPVIKINGKHCGLYNIGEQSDVDDDDEEEDEEQSEELGELDGRREDMEDDGYRSLSRTSTSLVQQLNDIRSRLIDLIDEIDQNVIGRLSAGELEAYERRRTALVSKLDALIDNHLQRASLSDLPPAAVGLDTKVASTSAATSQTDSGGSSLASSLSSGSLKRRALQAGDMAAGIARTLVKNKSLSNLQQANRLARPGESERGEDEDDDSRYEEQVQVFDYDFRRRASEHSALRNLERPLATAAHLSRVSAGNLCNPENAPIDFGAMMRDFEKNRKRQGEVGAKSQYQMGSESCDNTRAPKVTHHVASSSSTSTHSTSSRTSTSSFL